MWEEARAELERLRAANKLWPGEEASVRARIYLGEGRYEDVIKLARSFDSEHYSLEVPLALAHAKMGAHDTALRLAGEAVRQRLPGAEHAMGDVLAEKGDLDGALIWYERAGQQIADRAGALRAMGRTLMAMGDYREARSAYEQTIRWSGVLRIDDLHRLSECLRRLGRERAAQDVERQAQERSAPVSATSPT
jgi:tetratricopeptide (TPR) repeat protein